VDETHKIPYGGALLLDQVKDHPETKEIPVVIYTGKYTQFSLADLKKRGAKEVIRRKSTGSKVGDLGKQILDAFGIQYS
jgi:PleD family two-component response regulator